MQNMKMTQNGPILTIEVDLSEPGEPSATGKTMVLASSRGNVPVPGAPDVFVGLNVYRKR